MYIFHIIEKNVKQRGVHFSPIWKKYHKIQEGGGGAKSSILRNYRKFLSSLPSETAFNTRRFKHDFVCYISIMNSFLVNLFPLIVLQKITFFIFIRISLKALCAGLKTVANLRETLLSPRRS